MSEPGNARKPLSGTDWVFIVLAVAMAGGLAAFWYYYRAKPQPASASATEAAPEAQPSSPTVVLQAPRDGGAEPAADADRVRSLLAPVSAHSQFVRWLAEGDLLRRWLVVTDNLAEGVTPRKQLGFLAFNRPFTVVEVGNRTAIAPESYKRYDDFAEAIASVDARMVAKAYRELYGALEAGYQALGYPKASFDRVTAKALQRLEAAPVQEGEVFVERPEKAYVFTDANLEKLGSVEKHLLRMGPHNTRMIQAKAREIREALGLPASGQQR